MNYFDQQILAGLTKVPTPTHPGTLIVTGDAQPVFTGNNPGDTIMAACLYGKQIKKLVLYKEILKLIFPSFIYDN